VVLPKGYVDQLRNCAAHGAIGIVIPLHVQQRLDVAVARGLGLPHIMMSFYAS
jgi:hypothetical protein